MQQSTPQKPKNVTIVLLGLASLCNDVSSEMIIPILPLFITTLGGGAISIGLIGGLRESISNILPIFAGYFSDKIGRRKIFIFSGYIVSTICKIFLSWTKTTPSAIAFSSIERMGKGLRTASRDALIAESAGKKHGFGFGLHQALDTIGGIIGTLLALVLFLFLHLSFSTIIFIAALIGIIAIIPLLWLKHTYHSTNHQKLSSTLRKIPKPLKTFLTIAGIFALSNFSYMFFILKAQALFKGTYAVSLPLLLYLFFNLFYAGSAIPLGMLSDKMGRQKIIYWGYFLFSITCIGFAFAQSLISLIALFASYGIIQAIVNSNQRAWIADIAHDGEIATSLGVFHTVVGINAFIANLIAGFLYSYSPFFTFLYGATVSLLAVLIFLFNSTIRNH